MANEEIERLFSDLSEQPRIGYQAVCAQRDYTGPTVFVSPDALRQAQWQGEAEHQIPGHRIIAQPVSLN